MSVLHYVLGQVSVIQASTIDSSVPVYFCPLQVAVKVIDKKKAKEDTYVAKNFRREAKLLQMVHHPNILQLLEAVETDNSYYLITELCSGQLFM